MNKYLEAANWNYSLERTFTEVALPAEGAADRCTLLLDEFETKFTLNSF